MDIDIEPSFWHKVLLQIISSALTFIGVTIAMFALNWIYQCNFNYSTYYVYVTKKTSCI